MTARYLWPYIVRPLLVLVIAAGLLKLVVVAWSTSDGDVTETAKSDPAASTAMVGRVPMKMTGSAAEPSQDRAAGKSVPPRGDGQSSAPLLPVGIISGLAVLIAAGTAIFIGYRVKRTQADNLGRTISEVRLYGDAALRAEKALAGNLKRLDETVGRGPSRAEFDRLIEAVERQALTIDRIFAELPRLQPAELPSPAPAPASTLIAGDVAHQVFHERAVPRELIASRGETGSPPEHGTAEKFLRGGFALPSGAEAGTADIKVDAAQIEFPGPGIYALYTKLGARKILVLDEPPEDDAVPGRVIEFLASAMIEGAGDVPVFHGTADGPDRLTNKLFRGDQPVILHSLERCLLAARILAHEGFVSRILSIEPNELGLEAGYKGHNLLEIFLYGEQRWSLYDLHYNVCLVDANDRPLSIEDVLKLDADAVRPRPFAPIMALKPGFNLEKEAWSPGATTRYDFKDFFERNRYGYTQTIKEFLHRVTFRNPRLQAQNGDWLSYGTRICDSSGAMLGPEAATPMEFDTSAYEALTSIDITDTTWSGGHCYSAMLPEKIVGDSQNDTTASQWYLVEDSRVLARRHSSHEAIRLFGRGRYSHWSNALYFSASDNSSPLFNNRKYRLVKLKKENTT